MFTNSHHTRTKKLGTHQARHVQFHQNVLYLPGPTQNTFQERNFQELKIQEPRNIHWMFFFLNVFGLRWNFLTAQNTFKSENSITQTTRTKG